MDKKIKKVIKEPKKKVVKSVQIKDEIVRIGEEDKIKLTYPDGVVQYHCL